MANDSGSWCLPVREKHGQPCYVDSRLEDPATLERHIRDWGRSPPQVRLEIRGTHTRTYTTYSVTYCGNGTTAQLRFHVAREKVPDGDGRPKYPKKQAKVDQPATLSEWCQRFCADRSRLKRCTFRREMTGFDIGFVRRKMKALARDTGYAGSVDISLRPAPHNEIRVYNDVRANRWRLKGWVKFLFSVTFLWIVSLPYLKASTNKFGEVVVKWPFSRDAAYGGHREFVCISEEAWWNERVSAIRGAVLGRKQITIA
ncbi:hypothetical protein PG985_013135 [Apiospora marii]|uniref:Uncharacterized protein n=1 Tax=Apiospora marii TaxID=335849 RepID=A0ABR1R8Q3_9PEZI